MALQSELLKQVPGIRHGFGVLDETDIPELRAHWASLPTWQQVHGVALATVTQPQQGCGEVDALFTEIPALPVAVKSADCVPILMAQKEGKAVVAIHAGWRGTKALISQHVWRELISRGHSPKDWFAVVGPAIGPCCYEVSEELAVGFEAEFSRFGKSLAVPSFRKLDLPALNLELLKELGLGEVELMRHCTQCSVSPRFHSYRRTQGKSPGRQLSGLMRT